MNESRTEGEDDSLPDPFVEIMVANQTFSTKAHSKSRTPVFDESFVFKNVTPDDNIVFLVEDRDDNFNDFIFSTQVEPQTVLNNGWNGQLRFYPLLDSSSEGIWANITYN